MTETLTLGYSSESTQRELSNEYQHDRVKMVSEILMHESSLSIGRNYPFSKFALFKQNIIQIVGVFLDKRMDVT